MEILLLFWLVLSIGVGVLAAQRGRSGVGWALLSIVTSPLLGVILLVVNKDLVEEAAVRERETRRHDEKLAALAGNVREGNSKAQLAVAVSPVLVADELEKLGGLKERGLITEDEFVQQKRRLLGQSVAAPSATRAAPANREAVHKTPIERLQSAGQARAALVAFGCTVAGANDGPWSVIAPTGGRMFATSHAELVDFYAKL